ncbi:hypothetical protein EV361DRAFT_956802 [Lentinula raphanica]|nr:hypothetical protein EV361DRAFT_956802 [Lentinula raphanica]
MTSAAGIAPTMAAAVAHDAKGIRRRPHLDPVEKVLRNSQCRPSPAPATTEDTAKDKGKPAEESAKKEHASQSPHLLTKLLLHSRMRNTRPRRRRRPPRAPRKHRRTRRTRTIRRIPAAATAAEEAAIAEVANAEETPAAAEAPAQVRPLLPQSPLLRLLLKVRLDQPPTIEESILTPLENPASKSASKAPAKPTRRHRTLLLTSLRLHRSLLLLHECSASKAPSEAEPAADKPEAAPVVAAAAA